jgi:hypothetical protein
VLKLYGQEVNLFKLGRMPAQVIVDKAGVARFVHYGHSMSDIPSNAEILSSLDELNASPSAIPPVKGDILQPREQAKQNLATDHTEGEK